jgi:hypothetical protein
MSLDVLGETDTWSHFSNSGCNKWPEVSGIFCSESLAGGTKWLAWITERADVHAVTKV